jgi:hypothetical protein
MRITEARFIDAIKVPGTDSLLGSARAPEFLLHEYHVGIGVRRPGQALSAFVPWSNVAWVNGERQEELSVVEGPHGEWNKADPALKAEAVTLPDLPRPAPEAERRGPVSTQKRRR